MAPKKKAQKMALTDFFADTASGADWADEMPSLPTAPAPRDPTLPRRGEPGYLDSMPDRAARFTGGPPREELPLPTVPPFTAFVGNLTYETDEDALRDYFADLKPSSVRLVKDMGKPKGFGYVEFPSQDGLKEALNRNMNQLQGRTIRISVAEAPSGDRRGFGPSAAETADQWRRATPLPAREAVPAPGARRQPSYNDAPGPERDWSAARGTKFTPSVPPTPSGLRRESSGYGREREPLAPSVADEVNQWRSSKPLVDVKTAARDAPPHQRAPMGSGQSSPGLADTESTWSRGTKLRTPVLPAEPARSDTASPAEERDWRSSRATSAVPSTDGDSPRQAPAPLERRKLALAPRSVPATPSSSASPTTSSDSKGIFGAAKPVDSATRDAEAAKKLASRDEERKKAREEEIKREADKGRQLAEEKAKMIRDAQEKARVEAGGAPAPAPARGTTAPRGRAPPTGPRRTSSSEKRTVPAAEDGFEGVAKGRGSAQAPVPPPTTRKESTTRKGFSFAAAAGSGFNVDEEEEEKDSVDDVANGVKEVTV